MCLNEKHVTEGLYKKNVQEIRIKYHSDYGKDRYEKQKKKQYNRFFRVEKLVIKVITSTHKFRAILRFKQYDVTLTKVQPLPTEIMSSFDGENMQTEYNVLGCRVDLYFQDYKIAIEIDENGHSDRSIDYGIKRRKAIE